jgi:hypothetical protein
MSLDVSQTYGPSWPVTGYLYLFYLFILKYLISCSQNIRSPGRDLVPKASTSCYEAGVPAGRRNCENDNSEIDYENMATIEVTVPDDGISWS